MLISEDIGTSYYAEVYLPNKMDETLRDQRRFTRTSVTRALCLAFVFGFVVLGAVT